MTGQTMQATDGHDYQQGMMDFLMKVISDPRWTANIKSDGSLNSKFTPSDIMQKSLQAQGQAQKQTGGPTSLAGIMDPNIMRMIAGMQQQGNERADSVMPTMSQANYQTSLANQADRGPQRQIMDMAIKMLADKNFIDRVTQKFEQDKTLRGIPQAQTPATTASLLGGAKQSNEMANWLAGGGKDIAAKQKQVEFNQKRADIAATTKLDLLGGVVPKGTTNKQEYFKSSVRDYNNSLATPESTSLLVYADDAKPLDIISPSTWLDNPGPVEVNLGMPVAEFDKYIPANINRNDFIQGLYKRSSQLGVPVAAFIEQWIRDIKKNPVR